MTLPIPPGLLQSCRGDAARLEWLDALPAMVDRLAKRWSLTLASPFLEEAGYCAWVAPAEVGEGGSAVLKLALPHMEGEHEIAGLRFWDGDGTVHLLDADESIGALLLERCLPGTSLRLLPEAEQDRVLGALLPRLWRTPPAGHSFRSLQEMIAHWTDEVCDVLDRLPDATLAADGIAMYSELASDTANPVLLFTDLHARNVLRSQREPWLAIDPKPFVGDAAFDATQHLFNCPERMRRAPLETIAGFSDLLGVSRARVRAWMFARTATHHVDGEANNPWLDVARRLAP